MLIKIEALKIAAKIFPEYQKEEYFYIFGKADLIIAFLEKQTDPETFVYLMHTVLEVSPTVTDLESIFLGAEFLHRWVTGEEDNNWKPYLP